MSMLGSLLFQGLFYICDELARVYHRQVTWKWCIPPMPTLTTLVKWAIIVYDIHVMHCHLAFLGNGVLIVSTFV